MAQECTHTDQIKFRETNKRQCDECVKMGDRWVHLRMCLVCGNVGCCDSSKNKHATKHFHRSKHQHLLYRRLLNICFRSSFSAPWQV